MSTGFKTSAKSNTKYFLDRQQFGQVTLNNCLWKFTDVKVWGLIKCKTISPFNAENILRSNFKSDTSQCMEKLTVDMYENVILRCPLSQTILRCFD